MFTPTPFPDPVVGLVTFLSAASLSGAVGISLLLTLVIWLAVRVLRHEAHVQGQVRARLRARRQQARLRGSHCLRQEGNPTEAGGRTSTAEGAEAKKRMT